MTLSSSDSDFYTLAPRVNRIALDAAQPENKVQVLLLYPKHILKIRSALKRINPDVAISFLTEVNIQTVLSGFRPIVAVEQTDPRHVRPARLWLRLRSFAYARASALVVLTDEVKIRWAHPHGYRSVYVIPNPVDVPPLQLSEKTSAKTILAAGRLVPEKGFDLLLRAFAMASMEAEDWRLVICGEGPDRDRLLEQIRELGLTDRVMMPGLVRDLWDRMRLADIFVLSSRFEGFGNVLAEAMACGLPAISFDCPSGPSEIIKHGHDGLLVPPEDVEALAASMVGMMEDHNARSRLAANAVRSAERFSLDVVLDQWDKLFAKLR